MKHHLILFLLWLPFLSTADPTGEEIYLTCTCKYNTGVLTVSNREQDPGKEASRLCQQKINKLQKGQQNINFEINYIGQTGLGAGFQNKHYECLSVHQVAGFGPSKELAQNQALRACTLLSQTGTEGSNYTPRSVKLVNCSPSQTQK